jgi:hypothetical protein
MIKRFAAILLCIAAGSANAETKPDPLREAAAKAGRQIVLGTDGSASGPGWDALVGDMAAADFALVGEQHAVADIAHFAATLQRALAPHGYDYAAYEIGPYATETAELLLRAGPGKLEAISAQRPDRFAYPFLGLVEEAELARQIVTHSPRRQHVLWGLDQEFIGAGALMAERLRPLAQTPAQKQAVAEFAAAAAKNHMLLGTGPASTFDALKAAFADTGEASSIIDAMSLSNTIYAPFTDRGGAVYDANLLRENYMKANFVSRYTAAEKHGRPKVFMKFGGNHMMRGLSSTDVQSLGNFISEWGLARGLKSVNVIIDCAGGFQRDFQSGEAVPCESLAANPGMLFGDVAAATGITLFDLRPLRGLVRRKSDIDAETRRTIFAFDYYIVMREPKAATMVK